jgi:hypothetical protein
MRHVLTKKHNFSLIVPFSLFILLNNNFLTEKIIKLQITYPFQLKGITKDLTILFNVYLHAPEICDYN